MPPEWEVGGVMLKPFCLRHFLTLQSIDSPLLKEGAIPEPDDIILALRICSGDLGIKAVEAKPTWKEKWLNAKMVASPILMGEILLSFLNYTLLYSSPPKLWEKPKENGNIDVRKSKVPEVLMLVGLLIRKTSLTEQEVWTMPIGKVSWYATAVAVLEGVDVQTISTEDEEKFDAEQKELEAFQKKQLAKIKAQMANGKPPLPR
jgi:hypothetical protein